MKRNIFLITFSFITLFTQAQNFAPIGANWYYNGSDQGAAPTNSVYIHFESVKDTIVKGQLTRKIERTYYHFRGSVSRLEPLYVYNSTDTVFLYNPQKESFGKFYIFNRSKGDTLTLDAPYGDEDYSFLEKTAYRVVIDSVASATYNGKQVKKYWARGLDGFQYWGNGSFMDYIGGLDWFFPRRVMMPEADGPLRCYNDNNFGISFTSLPCDYMLTNGIPEVSSEEVSVYPNPTSDKFKVNALSGILKVELFDLNGVLRFQGNNLENDISKLETGNYLLKIELKDKTIVSRKIIKK